MKQRLDKLINKVWHLMAVVIVFLVAGPEILIGMELMALIEILGASTFVMLYFSGVKLVFAKAWQKFNQFESYSTFFIPPFKDIKTMPALILHAVPERTFVITFFMLISCTLPIIYLAKVI